MADQLFAGSVYDLRQSALQQAIERTKKISPTELLAPSLAGTLDKIASEFTLAIAKLKPDEIKGTRRKRISRRNDYGQMIDVEISVIDVTIPFDGDPESFKFAPSHSNIIDDAVEIHAAGLQISLPDDDNLDKMVKRFVAMVQENLDGLSKELSGLKEQVRNQIEVVANSRVEQIKKENERDKGRSFPIS
jgi:hypothetical protein